MLSHRELPGTVLRLPMIYGPGDPLRRFYPIVKRILDKRWHIIFPDTLAAWHSPRGFVENVAAAISLAATDDRAAGRIYNVCEEPSFSELEWARKIAAAMSRGWRVHRPARRTRLPAAPQKTQRQHRTALDGNPRRASATNLDITTRFRSMRQSAEPLAGRRKIAQRPNPWPSLITQQKTLQ